MKIVIVLAMFLFSSACVKAQSSSEIKPDQKSVSEVNNAKSVKNKPTRGVKSSASSKPGKYAEANVKEEGSIIPELNTIDEERGHVGNNELLPSTEIAQEILGYETTTKEALEEIQEKIKSRADYDAVMVKIEKIKKRNKIFLSTKQFNEKLSLIGEMPGYEDEYAYARWKVKMEAFTSRYISVNDFIITL
jgi:hypothetical protein